MKKRILLCILAALCLIFSGTAAMAAQNTAVLGPGDEFVLSLRFGGEIAGLQACIQWDASALELAESPAYSADFKAGSAVAMLNPQPDAGKLNLVYLRQRNLQADGAEALVLRLRVRDDAAEGMQEIRITDCRLADEKAEAVAAACTGFEFCISGSGEANWPAPVRIPGGDAAKLYFACGDGPAARPVPQPTVPGIHIEKEPEKTQDGLYLRTRSISGGFAVDLMADGIEIGGLQAEIAYDAGAAVPVHAAFAPAFLENALVHVINDEQPGRIALVVSNVNGYRADGSAIFTAQFACDSARNVRVGLENVKYTGAGSELAPRELAPQQLFCEIQPMDDLAVVEEDGVNIVEIGLGEAFSLTLDPAEVLALRLRDMPVHGVCWTCEREDVLSLTEEGLLEARASGLAEVAVRSRQDGSVLASGRICVRNTEFGLPLQILEISFGDGAGETFALSAPAAAEAYARRGVTLLFRDGEQTLRVTGLIPGEMDALPAGLFDLCHNLAEIEIAAENIRRVEAGAFAGCAALERLTLCNPGVELAADALPEGCRLQLPEEAGEAR